MATTGSKIDSPFAQYNGLQLLCKLCNSQVKSAKVWTAHVNGKQHREKLLELKSLKSKAEVFKVPAKRNDSVPSESSVAKKLKKSEENETNDKPTGFKLPKDFFDTSLNPGSGPSKPVAAHQKAHRITSSDKSVKASISGRPSSPEIVESLLDDKEKGAASSSTSIPEGFFDDKKLDAKARNVELKDPLDEEWSKFQKEMQQVQSVTDVIVEEDEDRFHLERTLDEIEDELRGWAKVNELEKKVEQIVVPSDKETSRSNSHIVPVDDEVQEDISLEEMMDWRSKQLWK